MPNPENNETFLRILKEGDPSAYVLLFVSFAEKLVLDSLQAKLRSLRSKYGVHIEPVTSVRLADGTMRKALGLESWDGWRALEGLLALRHCLAMEYGRTSGQQLSEFLAELNADTITTTNDRGETVTLPPFFSVDSTRREITLDREATAYVIHELGMGLTWQLRHLQHAIA